MLTLPAYGAPPLTLVPSSHVNNYTNQLGIGKQQEAAAAASTGAGAAAAACQGALRGAEGGQGWPGAG